MLEARFVPIEKWPTAPTARRQATPFYAAYMKTLDDLERELRHLGARDILIQAHFGYHQLRNDGWPRSGERPKSPGVILSFTTRNGPLSFPCDTYTAFEANLRAISLALTALRAIDRYGVTRRAEQYEGWRRIDPPVDRPFGSKEEASRFIVAQSAEEGREPDFSLLNDIIRDRELRAAAYRTVAARLHPDKPTGSHELFVKLQAAMRLLGAE